MFSLCSFTGAVLVRKVEKCGCMDSKCYREDYFVSYWEEVMAENGTEGTPVVASVREKASSTRRLFNAAM